MRVSATLMPLEPNLILGLMVLLVAILLLVLVLLAIFGGC